MSRDAKNSILLWVGTLAFLGLFWAFVHLDVGADIPDRWFRALLVILIGAHVFRLVWVYSRKRKANVR